MNKLKLTGIFVLIILMVFAAGCDSKPETVDEGDIQPTESDIQPTESDISDDIDTQPVESGIVFSDNGDIHITESGVILSDIGVEGDLYIDETVGEGDFTLQDVEIIGTLFINGGGENSGYLINVTGNEMAVSSEYGTRVVCANTSMGGVHLLTDCSIETDGDGLENVTVGSEAQDPIKVLLKGDYPEVTIESAAQVTVSGSVSLLAVLEGAELTSIDMVDDSKVYFYSCYGQSATVTGGAIIEAWINAEYCSLPENTDVVSTEVGIATVKLGDEDYDIPNWATPDVGEPAEGSDASSIFAVGYPKISRSGSVVTIVVVLEKEANVYALVEGPNVSLGDMDAIEITNPGIYADNPNYTPIHGNVSVSIVGEVYTFTINNQDINPSGGVAIFVVAVDVDGNESPIYRVVD